MNVHLGFCISYTEINDTEIIFDIAEVSGLSKRENSAIEDKFWRGKKKTR